MTWKFTSMSRTFSTSRIHREVIQHHGHSGSNQKSARDLSDMGAPLPDGHCDTTRHSAAVFPVRPAHWHDAYPHKHTALSTVQPSPMGDINRWRAPGAPNRSGATRMRIFVTRTTVAAAFVAAV